MKRALFIILGVLAIGLGQARAQVNPDYLSMKKGQFFDENGNVLTEGQIRQVIGDQIFEETYLGASKQFQAGKKLITFGAIGLGVGLVSAIGCGVAYNNHYESEGVENESLAAGMIGGYVLAVLGELALDAGIPLAIIGKSRLNWIADDYNEKTRNISMHVTGCSAGPGLGLAIVF